MNNLFVVRTPLQLLSAYIIAQNAGTDNYNHLMLLNPRGAAIWQKGYSVKKMSNDLSVWNKVTILQHRIARRSQLLKIKARLADMRALLTANGPTDMVYLGADREFENQLIVQLAGNSSYARLDDGVWSYSSPDRSVLEKIEFVLWAKIVHLLGGIPQTMTYNLRGGGYGKSAVADYLFKPGLLQRFSPKAVQIDQDLIHKTMRTLVPGMTTDEKIAGRKSIIFLGSTHVDKQQVNLQAETALLENLYQVAQRANIQFIYKPHPFEKKDKLEYYRQRLPEIYFADFADPIEVIVYKYTNIAALLAYSSSGLLYADVFAGHGIKTIALFDLFAIREKDPYVNNILAAAKVKIPTDYQSLLASISSL